jgi:hypothetical protein
MHKNSKEEYNMNISNNTSNLSKSLAKEIELIYRRYNEIVIS